MKFKSWLFSNEISESTQDADLVNAIRNGDESAWDSLLIKWEPRLRAFFNTRCPKMDIDELVQETLLAAIKYLRNQDENIKEFDKWIYVVAKSKIANVCRKKDFGNNIGDDFSVADGGREDAQHQGRPMYRMSNEPSDDIQRVEMQKIISKTLKDLETSGPIGEREANVLRQHYFQGIPLVTIADNMGLPLGTIKRTAFTAKNKLKSILNRYGVEEPI